MPGFDQMEIGYEIPVVVRREVTQARIDRWAEISVDFNPLHVDPDFARGTPFGSTISHGTLTITFIMEMLTRWLGDGWTKGGKLLGMKFVAPVTSGETVKAAGRVTGKRVQGKTQIVECEVWLEKEDGTRAIIGRAESQLE